MKGGLGATPPARGRTPAPRPNHNDYRYKGQFSAFLSIVLRIGLGLRLAVSWFTAVYVTGSPRKHSGFHSYEVPPCPNLLCIPVICFCWKPLRPKPQPLPLEGRGALIQVPLHVGEGFGERSSDLCIHDSCPNRMSLVGTEIAIVDTHWAERFQLLPGELSLGKPL